MIKKFVAVTAITLALAACSSSDSSDNDNDAGTDSSGDGDVGGNGGNEVVDPPGGGLPPETDTKAGSYIGDFGSGEGVYVIDNDNALSGLALGDDGSAYSLFGDVGDGNTFSGELRSYYHAASEPSDAGVFGAGADGSLAAVIAPTEFDLNIVNGQTITSLSGNDVSLVGSGTGALTPATETSVAGAWSGDHRFCGSDITACDVLRTEVTFNGSTVNGQTVIIKPDGSEVFANPIDGNITEFGDVSLLSFSWNSSIYNGLVFFAPGETGKLVFLGETSAEADNKTIASLLTQ